MLIQLERTLAKAERKLAQVTAEKDAESAFFAMTRTKSLLESAKTWSESLQKRMQTELQQLCMSDIRVTDITKLLTLSCQSFACSSSSACCSCCCKQRVDKEESATESYQSLRSHPDVL